MRTFALIKGYDAMLCLLDDKVKTANLRHGKTNIPLRVGDEGAVYITEANLAELPVPKTAWGVLECKLVINNTAHRCVVHADPENPKR